MDDLAHALAGTLMGRAQPSKARGLILACVLGALAPDIDVLLSLWGRDFYITEHRGFTHSALGLIPTSLFAAWLAWLALKRIKGGASFKALWAMAFLGVVSHDFMDWCTNWGTMLLWPNRTRFALDHLFIVDIWYSLLLALPVLASAFWKEQRVKICVGGLALVAAYHALAAYNHHRALALVQNDRPGTWVAAFPQPFSPFRWSAFNRGEGLVKHVKIDFLKSGAGLEWDQWPEPPQTPAAQAAMDSPEGKRFMWFARMPMWEEEKKPDGTIEVGFWDMRFQTPYLKDRVGRRFGARVVVKDGKVVEESKH